MFIVKCSLYCRTLVVLKLPPFDCTYVAVEPGYCLIRSKTEDNHFEKRVPGTPLHRLADLSSFTRSSTGVPHARSKNCGIYIHAACKYEFQRNSILVHSILVHYRRVTTAEVHDAFGKCKPSGSSTYVGDGSAPAGVDGIHDDGCGPQCTQVVCVARDVTTLSLNTPVHLGASAIDLMVVDSPCSGRGS